MTATNLKGKKKRVPLSSIKFNGNNPRKITAAKLDKLKRSILHLPEMMKARPLIVGDDLTVLGGNMRLRALNELRNDPEYLSAYFEGDLDRAKTFKRQHLDKTWVEYKTWDDEHDQEFVIKDNLSYGEWDFDELLLIDDFSKMAEDYGMDIPSYVFRPVTDPTLDTGSMTPEEIDRKAEELRKVGGTGRVVIETICPHCGQEFEIDRQ